ncbi:MAG TPA: hypothetical protein VKE88_02005 [Candidatus Nanoarchaeia archaeon]|nr:hypothetical protein [Candidatus Nanoarchaeia archaeon]
MKKIDIKPEWIEKLIETKSIYRTAEFFKVDRSNMWRYFKRLEKADILSKKDNYWYIKDYEKLMIELHAVQATVKISGWKEQMFDLLHQYNECSNIWMNNKTKPNQYFFDFREIPQFTIKIMGDTLIFIQKKETPLRLPRNIEAVQKLRDIIEIEMRGKFKFLERKLACKIGDIEELRLNIVENHYAFLSDLLAKKFIADDEKLKVYINNELRTVIDLSKGKEKPEFEEVHPKHAPTDALAWEKFCTRINTGEFNPDFVNTTLQQVVNNQAFHEENIKSHVVAIQEMSSILKKLDERLNRQTL